MVVQAVNTGGDLGNNHFDLAVSHLMGIPIAKLYQDPGEMLNNLLRFPAAALAYSTAAPRNGEHLRTDGERSTVGSHQIHAMSSHRLCKLAATGGLTGSRTRIIQGEHRVFL
jgi:hypothetical protein